MIFPAYKDCPLIPTRSAMKELCDLGIDLATVVEVLESGYDCCRSKRKTGTIERCVDKGSKTMKIVAVQSYNYSLRTEVWAITHAGMFTKRR
jgi:hypothetical protein